MRRYERPDYLGGGMISFDVYPGNNRSFTVSDGETVKTVSVRNVRGYVFNLTKSGISARGGAVGLYKYVDKCLFEHFCACFAWRILNHVLTIGEEAL